MPPCRFLFDCIIIFTVKERARELVRRVLQRGKALIHKAYIAVSNERNKHGSFIHERRHPFRSSSSHVHQVVSRCNGDVQFKDRTVPADVIPDAGVLAESGTSEPIGGSGLFFGARALSDYMTKYQSKAQQTLSAAMGPSRQVCGALKPKRRSGPKLRQRRLRKQVWLLWRDPS